MTAMVEAYARELGLELSESREAAIAVADPDEAPRLAPTTDADWDADTAELIGRLGALNIFTTLAHHPDLLRRWLVFGRHILGGSTLPARERELVILRTGWLCQAEYEFGHHRVIGTRAGLTGAEIRRIAAQSVDAEWSARDRTLLLATDQLVATRRLDDELWAAVSGDWSVPQVLDLVFTVGQYVLVSTALNTFGVRLEDGFEGFPR